MRDIRQSELHEAKTRLRELEDRKPFGPDHLVILSARRALRQKSAAAEAGKASSTYRSAAEKLSRQVVTNVAFAAANFLAWSWAYG